MSVRRIIAVLVISLIACQGLLHAEAFAQGSEDIQKELKELKQMMEKMQKRIDDLEEKNSALEQQAREREEDVTVKDEDVLVKEETVTVPATPSQGEPQGFFEQGSPVAEPGNKRRGLDNPDWYSLNDPVVFAQNDPKIPASTCRRSRSGSRASSTRISGSIRSFRSARRASNWKRRTARRSSAYRLTRSLRSGAPGRNSAG